MSKLFKSTIIGLMIAGFTTGCVKTNDIEVVASKAGGKTHLQGYKTYQISSASGLKKDSLSPDELAINKELHQIINDELTKQGKRSVTENPDFYVTYLANTDMNAIKEKVDEKGKKIIETAPDASMLLTFIDANTDEIIYLSSAKGDFKNLPLAGKRKRLKHTIKEMLDAMYSNIVYSS